jgi:hypothetical protein
MSLHRKTLFDTLKKTLYKGPMTAQQVRGWNAVLDCWERDATNNDLRWLAYEGATAHHETGGRMWPIIEATGAKDKTPISVDTAIARLDRAWKAGKMPWVKRRYWAKDARGISWLGRGLPQTTHEDNYKKAQALTGHPVHSDPENMLKIEYACDVMHKMMVTGKFTGHSLRNFFNGTKCDWSGARRIINGTESAAKVAGYARIIYAALTAADAVDEEEPTHVPAPKELDTKPLDATIGSASTGVPAVITGLHVAGVVIPWWLVIGTGVAVVAGVGYLVYRYRLQLRDLINKLVEGGSDGEEE